MIFDVGEGRDELFTGIRSVLTRWSANRSADFSPTPGRFLKANTALSRYFEEVLLMFSHALNNLCESTIKFIIEGN
jgi:hypothetical protein